MGPCRGAWVKVADQLILLVQASELGRALFEDPLASAMASRLGKSADKGVSDLFDKKQHINMKLYAHSKSAIMDQVKGMDGIEMLPSKRDISVQFRGQLIKLRIGSLAEEVDTRYASHMKGCATQAKKLAMLWCDDVLVASDAKLKFQATFASDLIKEASAARTMAANLLKDAGADTADEVVKILQSKVTTIALTDTTFKLEMALLNDLTGDGTQGRFLLTASSCACRSPRTT